MGSGFTEPTRFETLSPMRDRLRWVASWRLDVPVRLPSLRRPRAPLAFQAVSIKPNTSGSGNVSVTTTRGQLMGTNMPARMLVRMAYGVQDFQVVDLPDWAENSRYDVTARGANETGEPFRARLRQMLVDRFGAQITRGTRELPIYALVVNKAGTLGPWLKVTSIEDCSPRGSGCDTSINNRVVRATAVEMASLSVTLAAFVGRTVIDRPGLAGVTTPSFPGHRIREAAPQQATTVRRSSPRCRTAWVEARCPARAGGCGGGETARTPDGGLGEVSSAPDYQIDRTCA